MSTTPFSIDPQQVADAGSSAQRTYSEIEQLLAALTAKVTSLESNALTGAGGQAVQSLFQKFNTSAKTLNDELNQIGSALNLTSTRASELQQSIVTSFSSGG